MTLAMMEMKAEPQHLDVEMQEMQIIEFALGKDRFAIDIQFIKEIVEYKRIRPLPNSPSHVKGIIDLRGDITTIIDLVLCLHQQSDISDERRRIIILNNQDQRHKIGLLVDDVYSVLAIDHTMIDYSIHQHHNEVGYIRGIIKISHNEEENFNKSLIIWLNIEQILCDI